jgi:hypothetical protein
VFSIALGFCVPQSFELISYSYLRWVIVCFLQLILFIVGTFVVLGRVLFLPLALTACQDSRSLLSSLSMLSSASENGALLVAAWAVCIA